LSPLEITALTVFILILCLGVFSIVFGLPGTIIILIDAVVYALVTGFQKIGIKILIILLLISIVAEALDFALGMMGAAKFGASAKGIWASIIGATLGAVALTPVFFGLGTIMGIFFGAFAAVVIVELIQQSQLKQAIRAGYGVLLGRFAGMFVKGILALVMITITLTHIYS
jgi:hypothetical protein